MKFTSTVVFCIALLGCELSKKEELRQTQNVLSVKRDSIATRPYEEIKESIKEKRKQFSFKYSSLSSFSKKEILEEISTYWVTTISNDLYSKWENTPWDFNGTTTKPQQGNIACGFFVATLLRDMDLKVNRRKLSVCASSQMMKSLTPKQRIKNLSYLSYSAFNKTMNECGKGVYIIGLDFHTGFIINDGKENWFIHSNYIGRKGVTKELVINSTALKSSKTRWVVSLTGDKNFLEKWLKG